MSKRISPALSRRNFLVHATSAGSAMLLGSAWLHAIADASDPRLAEVLSKTIAIDMHNHVYPTGTEPHPRFSSDPQGQPPQEPPSLPLGEELKHSGLTAVCAAITIDFAPNKKPGDARDYFLRWLDALDRELEKARIHRALTLHDLEAAHTRQKPTIVQSTEGAHFLEGHIERLEEVYKRGLRHLQPLHDRDDLVAPLGDVITNPPHLGGLTHSVPKSSRSATASASSSTWRTPAQRPCLAPSKWPNTPSSSPTPTSTPGPARIYAWLR